MLNLPTMKQVFSLLIAFVFLQTETWAIGGGPQGSGVSSTSILGDYGGALLPTSSSRSNGLGLFTLNLPKKGLGKGDFVYFSEGKTFTGKITGLADPSTRTFLGLLKGQFDVVVSSLAITDQFFGNASVNQTQPGGFANGTVKAKFDGGGSSTVGTGSGLRIKGTSVMQISELTYTTVVNNNGTPNNPLDDTTSQRAAVTTTSTLNLVVDGFQQAVFVDTGA